MLDLTKPVQNKKGTHVKILYTDLAGSYPILGILETAETKTSMTWSKSGEFCVNVKCEYDLENVPEYKWINYYADGGCYSHPSREDADLHSTANRLACIKFKIGQFDE